VEAALTLDPRVGFYFSIVLAICTALAALGTQYTTLFGEATADKILAGMAIANAVGGAVNAILHAIPSGSTPADQAKFMLGPKNDKA